MNEFTYAIQGIDGSFLKDVQNKAQQQMMDYMQQLNMDKTANDSALSVYVGQNQERMIVERHNIEGQFIARPWQFTKNPEQTEIRGTVQDVAAELVKRADNVLGVNKSVDIFFLENRKIVVEFENLEVDTLKLQNGIEKAVRSQLDSMPQDKHVLISSDFEKGDFSVSRQADQYFLRRGTLGEGPIRAIGDVNHIVETIMPDVNLERQGMSTGKERPIKQVAQTFGNITKDELMATGKPLAESHVSALQLKHLKSTGITMAADKVAPNNYHITFEASKLNSIHETMNLSQKPRMIGRSR